MLFWMGENRHPLEGCSFAVRPPWMDSDDKCMGAVLVPPCVAASKVGELLGGRMLRRDWCTWGMDEIDAEWWKEVPISGLLEIQHKLGVKRGPGEDRACAVCGAVSRTKCSLCFATHYCSRECQKTHWTVHRDGCRQPSPKVAGHVGVVMPDYACFWNFMGWLERNWRAKNQGLGIMVVTRAEFIKSYGEAAEKRSILSLALHGRPACYVCRVFSKEERQEEKR